MHGVTPVTSMYSVDEVRRNIKHNEHHLLFEELLKQTMRVSDGPLQFIPGNVHLVAKDKPILATAIFASVDYLVTGDVKHFGHLYGATVSHVKILSPADFLDLYAYRLKD